MLNISTSISKNSFRHSTVNSPTSSHIAYSVPSSPKYKQRDLETLHKLHTFSAERHVFKKMLFKPLHRHTLGLLLDGQMTNLPIYIHSTADACCHMLPVLSEVVYIFFFNSVTDSPTHLCSNWLTCSMTCKFVYNIQ